MSTRRHPPVPTTSQVIPGASVNIVLKADQPTGRTVQGIVRDVLTRGNHPRGIKVRLADGRVGRVQTMASGSTAASSSGPPSSGENPGPFGSLVGGARDMSIGGDPEQGPSYDHSYDSGRGPRGGGRRGGRGGSSSRGFDDEPDLPSQQIGLDAYVKQVKPKRAGKGKGKTSPVDVVEEEEVQAVGSLAPPETVTCPVCGTFEGDETAVAHHVAAHFDTGS
ncbi:Uncharacterized protein YwbE [Cytospora mali]|uniref:Uncharacterized protein YwbE n=1 Tax=Cytospora mali TaxID=578113 RepID=A0A194VM44_CYTMA|nr:Uncharacterized protein YwbE [Valsa mali]